MGNKKKYHWQIGSPPPPLDEHSAAKHSVFRSYVQRYIEILTSDPRHDGLNLTLVDGFSGGGEYIYSGQVQPGSPIILLEEIACAQAGFAATRTKPFALRAEFVFVEQRKQSLEYLYKTISQTAHASGLGVNIHLINSEFESLFDYVLQSWSR